MDKDTFHSTNKGTPQGALLSPLLANIALNGMEKILKITYKKITKKNGYVYYSTIGKYRMVRYADDFVIFAQSKENIEALYDILDPYLKERGLQLAEEKTRIVHISEGFDFLGFNFRRYETFNGFIHLSKPSKDSEKQFKMKIAEICKNQHGHNVDDLITKLNSLIRGTTNYWKPTATKKIFTSMDNYIWNKVFKFIKRLHPNKPMYWIKERYFPYYYDGKHYGNWILTGPKEGYQLIKMVWTPVKRHNMIKYNYSPYDKSKSKYFSNREFKC
jgi:RNA-directed DNA polymerase